MHFCIYRPLKYVFDVCRISSFRSLLSRRDFFFSQCWFFMANLKLLFKPLFPSDLIDWSKAGFSFPDSLNVHGDTLSDKFSKKKNISFSNLIISACLSRTSTIWPGSGHPITSPGYKQILIYTVLVSWFMDLIASPFVELSMAELVMSSLNMSGGSCCLWKSDRRRM